MKAKRQLARLKCYESATPTGSTVQVGWLAGGDLSEVFLRYTTGRRKTHIRLSRSAMDETINNWNKCLEYFKPKVFTYEVRVTFQTPDVPYAWAGIPPIESPWKPTTGVWKHEGSSVSASCSPSE